MIGIICAMEVEMELLKEKLVSLKDLRIQGIRFYEGQIANKEVVLCLAGVGKVHAAMATSILLEVYNCELIINTGIAGGITGVETEDIVLASEIRYFDVDVTPFGYQYGQLPSMPSAFIPSLIHRIQAKKVLKKYGQAFKEAIIYTGDSFVHSLEQLKNVDISIPCVAEMEGAAVAQVCTKAGIDFLVLRFISDIVGKKNQIEDYKKFEENMARRSSEICLEILHYLE